MAGARLPALLRILTLLGGVLLVTAPVHAGSSPTAAADFSLPGRTAQVRLSAAKGKVVYLDFWASWCGPCRLSFPWMNLMQARYGAKGLQVIAVNVDEKPDDALRFLALVPADFTIAFDSRGDTPAKYGVKGMPMSYLVDRDGVVVYRHMGFNAADRDELERQIRQALGVAP
ncbi:MAG TPA: TlpA disulfide reductase family protein [Rhodocyclaceae bacterium]